MTFRKLFFALAFLSVLTITYQYTVVEDLNVTVTDPSVFHEEYQDYKTTVIGTQDDPMMSPRGLRPLNLTDFTDTSDDSSECSCQAASNDTSDSTSDSTSEGTSEGTSDDSSECSCQGASNNTSDSTSDSTSEGTSEGTSDDSSECSCQENSNYTSNDTSDSTSDSTSDDAMMVLDVLIGAAKDLEAKVAREFNKEMRLTKLQAKKNWHALKHKMIREARAANITSDEIKEQIESAKFDAKQAWRDLKWKLKNGNDILDELLANTDPLNPNTLNRGNTEPILDNSSVYNYTN